MTITGETVHDADAMLRALAHGLDRDDVERLLERVSASDCPEMLRARLATLGARAFLQDGQVTL